MTNLHNVLNENSDSVASLREFSAQGYQYEPEYSTQEELENISYQSQRAQSEH